ncbi:type 4a pilus biogenesis protein PilO [Pseudomonas sp. MPFS]|uniref:type 4a pilus biogenesis protein PilO n=1 Tax=Pseudomonas sp. MPFS TaxID=2795724 RepID=UPI001F12D80F|nr:type 4a pilus biogenesis protein PilO [Pseudomonas sp. MPFS]UMZ12563.1 type 4a pilus biogenesis protein PilO [Pseudomonas sp. MPFS]
MNHWLGAIQAGGFDWRTLDLGNPGAWPEALKGVLLILLMCLVLAVGQVFYLGAGQEQWKQMRQEHVRLKARIAGKFRQAGSLDSWREQVALVRENLDRALEQFFQGAEIPGLLEDISRLGQDAGLVFEAISLRPGVSRQFLVQLPIQISVVGGYHELATFAAGLAGLPRMVTLHDLRISPVEGHEPVRLRMNVEARIYRLAKQDSHP